MNDKRPYWFLGTALWVRWGCGKAGRRVLLSCAPGRYSIAPCPSSSRRSSSWSSTSRRRRPLAWRSRSPCWRRRIRLLS